MSTDPLLSRHRTRAVLLAAIVGVGAAIATPAQVQVRYGEPARMGKIKSPNQTDRYLLVGAQPNDLLRITFCSQNSGYPNNTYYHQLEVRDGTTSLGTIKGKGTLTSPLTGASSYLLEVRAQNNQYTGWYAFQIDRLNDPVGADRIATSWNMNGSIDTTAAFAVYTLRGTAGSSAVLRLTCKNSGYPNFTYYHYAELLDSAGKRVVSVSGNGAKAFTFPATDVYTLFVAATNYEYTGWYAVSVDCQSWPGTPCDCTAYAGNYGEGTAGSSGVPTLAARALPVLGTTPTLDVGNPYPSPTMGVVFLGVSAASIGTTYGGSLLVAQPAVLGGGAISLPPGGSGVPLPVPNDPFLCGLGIALQSVVVDPAASGLQVSFSPGLLLLLGR